MRARSLDPERLGHIVVGAEIEGADLAALVGAAGQHDDRQCRAAPAQLPDDFEAVDVRQGQIEDEDVDRALAKGSEGAPAVLAFGYQVTLGREAGAEEAADGRLVVDHQNAVGVDPVLTARTRPQLPELAAPAG